MKSSTCVFKSLADFQKCFPNSKPSTEEEFQEYLKRVDAQIAQAAAQGIQVDKVEVDPDEYLEWVKSAGDYVKKMPASAQRATFATAKTAGALKSKVVNAQTSN